MPVLKKSGPSFSSCKSIVSLFARFHFLNRKGSITFALVVANTSVVFEFGFINAAEVDSIGEEDAFG